MLKQAILLQFFLFILACPASVLSQQQRVVGPNADFTTIQAAIDASAAGDTVRIEPGTYTENLIINSDITLRGNETARVILESADTGNAGTILTISSVRDVSIRNLTFARGETGIAVDSSFGVDISNNVFNLNDSSTGINITDQGSTVSILNNSFIDNNIAISSSTSSDLLTIENNIFSGNNTPLEPDNGADNVSYNCYATGETIIGNEDLLTNKQGEIGFANQAILDFHLATTSVCTDIGGLGDAGTDAIDETPADAGAYGGQLAEPHPYPPQSLIASANNDPGNYSIQLSWQRNNSYLIKYYKVYYGSQQSGVYNGSDAEDENTGNAFLSGDNAGNVTSITLDALTAPETTPDTPTLFELQPSFGQIALNWSPVANANSYAVYWGLSSTDENSIAVGDVTSYTIQGLQNGETYQVQVAAIKQARYYLAVSAVATSLIDNPSNDEIEGALSQEEAINIGSPLESPRSDIQTAIPEEVVPFPPLPDTGDERCFIASSTYGNKNAVEVLILRQFRDQFLTPNLLGRHVIEFYYRYSPGLADWLNRNVYLKPVIQIIFLPAVWLAMVLTAASTMQLASLLLLFVALYLVRWRQSPAKPEAQR